MTPQHLNRSVQQSVDAAHGGPINVPGMTRPVIHPKMKEKDSNARKAIDRGLADMRAGRVRPWKEAYKDLSKLM